MLYTYFTYFLMLITAFSFSYIGMKKNKLQLKLNAFNDSTINYFEWNKYYFLSYAVIVIIAGIRKDVGIDYYGYQKLFENFNIYSPLYSLYNFEPFFIIIVSSLTMFSNSAIYFFFIYAFFTWFFFFISFKYNVKILPFTLLFLILSGFYFWTFNGVRQAVAITIFAFSINFIISKDFLKYVITIIIGLLFHYSIIILIPLYFIAENKIFDKLFKRIPLLFFYILTILINSFELLRDLAKYIFLIIPKYEVHINNMYTMTNEQNTGLGIIFNHIINIFIIIISKPIIKRLPESKIYFNLFFIGMLLANMVEGIQIFGRFVIYFTFFKIYVLGYITYYLLRKNTVESRTILSLLVLGYVVLFIAVIYFGGPYQTLL